jgi:hypothetical protein
MIDEEKLELTVKSWSWGRAMPCSSRFRPITSGMRAVRSATSKSGCRAFRSFWPIPTTNFPSFRKSSWIGLAFVWRAGRPFVSRMKMSREIVVWAIGL